MPEGSVGQQKQLIRFASNKPYSRGYQASLVLYTPWGVPQVCSLRSPSTSTHLSPRLLRVLGQLLQSFLTESRGTDRKTEQLLLLNAALAISQVVKWLLEIRLLSLDAQTKRQNS